MKLSKLVISLTATALLIGATSSAHATCTKFGYVARVVTFDGVTFGMFRERQSSNNYFQFRTSDLGVANAAYQAFKGKSRMLVRTTIASCPATATTGKTDIGTADRIGLGY